MTPLVVAPTVKSTRPPVRRMGTPVSGTRYGGNVPMTTSAHLGEAKSHGAVDGRSTAGGVKGIKSIAGGRVGTVTAPRADEARGGAQMVVLRREIGDVLRDARQRQGRTLREVSSAARVSLGYLSEVERGQKEASSELLHSICEALDLPLSLVLREVSDRVAVAEGLTIPDTVPADLAASLADSGWTRTWTELTPIG